MKRFHISFCLAVALSALPLAIGIAAPEEDRKCSIEGFILDAGTGTPLAGAEVSIHKNENNPPIVVKSDSSGHYFAADLEPGHYSMYAEHVGYVSRSYEQRKRSREGTALILRPGNRLQGIDFRLIATGAIAGRVLSEDGEPIEGATVQAFAPRYAEGERRFMAGAAAAKTNDLGEYRIYGLAPDNYYVGVSGQEPRQTLIAESKDAPREERYLPTLYPNVTSMDHATVIAVGPGSEVRGINVVPLKGHTFHIRGHIVGFGPTDRYTSVQLVAVSAGWEIGRRGAEIAPDPSGNFELSGIIPGSYIVSAFGVRNGSLNRAWRFVQIEDADVDEVALTPSADMELRGRVRVEGGARIDLRKLSLDLSNPFSGTKPWVPQLTSDRSFVLHGVGHYVYRIEIFSLPEDCYVKSVRLADEEVARTTIDLSNVENPPGMLEIVVSGTGGRIDGLVKNEKDEPKGGAVVVLIPDSSHRRETDLFKNTTTDENGRFVISGIRPGGYKLFAWDDIEPGSWWDHEFLSRYEAKGEEIEIATNGRVSLGLHLISANPQ